MRARDAHTRQFGQVLIFLRDSWQISACGAGEEPECGLAGAHEKPSEQLEIIILKREKWDRGGEVWPWWRSVGPGVVGATV